MFLADADRVMLAGKRVLGIAHGDRRLLGFTNHALNPGFEKTGAPAEVRRNWIINPAYSENLTGWSAASGASRESVPGVGALVSATNVDGAPSGNQIFQTTGGGDIPVQAGDVVTSIFTVEAPGSNPRPVRIRSRITEYRTDLPTIWGTGGTLDIAPGETVQVVYERVMQEGANLIRLSWLGDSSQLFTLGDELLVHDGWTVKINDPVVEEISPTIPSPDPDMIPSWTGTANASPSILSVQAASGLPAAPGNGSKTFSSTQWASSGERSLRVLREGSPGQAAAGAVIQSSWYPPPGVVTILATCHIPEGYDASEDVSAGQAVSRGIFLLSALEKGYAQAPPVPGTYPLRITVDRASESIRLGGGGLLGQSVYWDNLAIIEGVYDGAPFNGDSPGGEWLGTPHASPSWIWHP